MDARMKLAVLGATGETGEELVSQALDDGHQVLALVRNPDKMIIKHNNLQVKLVDVLVEDSLSEHLARCDAVLVCLGTSISFFDKITLLTDNCRATVGAMRQNDIKRLICLGASCSLYDPSNPKFVEWFLKPVFIGRNTEDHGNTEKYLMEECPDINYTVVKPEWLTNQVMDSRRLLTHEGQRVPDASLRIPRANVAKFMLSLLHTDRWDRKSVAIALPD